MRKLPLLALTISLATAGAICLAEASTSPKQPPSLRDAVPDSAFFYIQVKGLVETASQLREVVDASAVTESPEWQRFRQSRLYRELASFLSRFELGINGGLTIGFGLLRELLGPDLVLSAHPDESGQGYELLALLLLKPRTEAARNLVKALSDVGVSGTLHSKAGKAWHYALVGDTAIGSTSTVLLDRAKQLRNTKQAAGTRWKLAGEMKPGYAALAFCRLPKLPPPLRPTALAAKLQQWSPGLHAVAALLAQALENAAGGEVDEVVTALYCDDCLRLRTHVRAPCTPPSPSRSAIWERLPADVAIHVAGGVDIAGWWERLTAQGQSKRRFEAEVERYCSFLKIDDFRYDLLSLLGPELGVSVWEQRSHADAPLLPAVSLALQLRDRAEVARIAHKSIRHAVSDMLKDYDRSSDGHPKGPRFRLVDRSCRAVPFSAVEFASPYDTLLPGVEPAYHVAQEFLFLSSSAQAIEKLIGVQNRERYSLADAERFRRLATKLPLEGHLISYADSGKLCDVLVGADKLLGRGRLFSEDSLKFLALLKLAETFGSVTTIVEGGIQNSSVLLFTPR